MIPAVEAELRASEKAVLLVHPGLLARYAQMEMLERLRDQVGRKGACPGMWVLVAADGQSELPVIDGREVPLISSGQRARVPDPWLKNAPLATAATLHEHDHDRHRAPARRPATPGPVPEGRPARTVPRGARGRRRAARGATGRSPAAGRTAQAFEDWRDDYLEQVAVAWVLACVFVRYMEDNDLIAETYLAGTGDRRRQAEDAHEGYFRAHPRDSDRDYLLDVFRRVGSIPAARDLFAEGKTPLWAVGPSGDGARAAAGVLARDRPRDRRPAAFVASRGGRHAVPGRPVPGPLRGGPQEVRAVADAGVRRGVHPRPHADAGPRRVRPGGGPADRPDLRLGPLPAGGVPAAVRACGPSASRRTEPAVLAQRALDAVYGVDVNPFAVAIARFRLIVEAMHAVRHRAG